MATDDRSCIQLVTLSRSSLVDHEVVVEFFRDRPERRNDLAERLAIGVYAGLSADCEVWLSDDDRVATACAECSLEASGVDATVVTADCTAGVADRTFDRVCCNPPTHAGNGVLDELFAGIADVLARGGELTTVHHRDLDLRGYLSRFDRVETRRTGAEHVVLSATG